MASNMDDMMRRRMAAAPTPYFTNAEGLRGLEEGLATGLPYFSVFKINAPIFYGMVQADFHPNACYTRNFTIEMIPPPPPATMDSKDNPCNLYNTYGMLRYVLDPYVAGGSERLVYSKWVDPRVKQLADDRRADESVMTLAM